MMRIPDETAATPDAAWSAEAGRRLAGALPSAADAELCAGVAESVGAFLAETFGGAPVDDRRIDRLLIHALAGAGADGAASAYAASRGLPPPPPGAGAACAAAARRMAAWGVFDREAWPVAAAADRIWVLRADRLVGAGTAGLDLFVYPPLRAALRSAVALWSGGAAPAGGWLGVRGLDVLSRRGRGARAGRRPRAAARRALLAHCRASLAEAWADAGRGTAPPELVSLDGPA
jgi:hypothetical protein